MRLQKKSMNTTRSLKKSLHNKNNNFIFQKSHRFGYHFILFTHSFTMTIESPLSEKQFFNSQSFVGNNQRNESNRNK